MNLSQSLLRVLQTAVKLSTFSDIAGADEWMTQKLCLYHQLCFFLSNSFYWCTISKLPCDYLSGWLSYTTIIKQARKRALLLWGRWWLLQYQKSQHGGTVVERESVPDPKLWFKVNGGLRFLRCKSKKPHKYGGTSQTTIICSGYRLHRDSVERSLNEVCKWHEVAQIFA